MALLGLEGSKPSRSTWRPGDRSLFRPILPLTGPVDPGCRSAARRRLSSVTTDSIAGLSVDLLFLLYDDSNYVPLGLIMFAVKFSANPTVQTAAEASDSPSRPGLAPSPSGQTRKKAANRRSSMISPH